MYYKLTKFYGTFTCKKAGNNEVMSINGEISNFYNLSPRLLFFGIHVPPRITIHAAKFH